MVAVIILQLIFYFGSFGDMILHFDLDAFALY